MVKYLPLTAKHFSLKANTAILFYIPWNAKKNKKKILINPLLIHYHCCIIEYSSCWFVVYPVGESFCGALAAGFPHKSTPGPLHQ